MMGMENKNVKDKKGDYDKVSIIVRNSQRKFQVGDFGNEAFLRNML